MELTKAAPAPHATISILTSSIPAAAEVAETTPAVRSSEPLANNNNHTNSPLRQTSLTRLIPPDRGPRNRSSTRVPPRTRLIPRRETTSQLSKRTRRRSSLSPLFSYASASTRHLSSQMRGVLQAEYTRTSLTMCPSTKTILSPLAEKQFLRHSPQPLRRRQKTVWGIKSKETLRITMSSSTEVTRCGTLSYRMPSPGSKWRASPAGASAPTCAHRQPAPAFRMLRLFPAIRPTL